MCVGACVFVCHYVVSIGVVCLLHSRRIHNGKFMYKFQHAHTRHKDIRHSTVYTNERSDYWKFNWRAILSMAFSGKINFKSHKAIIVLAPIANWNFHLCPPSLGGPLRPIVNRLSHTYSHPHTQPYAHTHIHTYSGQLNIRAQSG